MSNHDFEPLASTNSRLSGAGAVHDHERVERLPQLPAASINTPTDSTTRGSWFDRSRSSRHHSGGDQIYESWESFTARTLREAAHVDDLERELTRATTSPPRGGNDESESGRYRQDHKYFRPTIVSKHLDNPSRQRVQEELESALRERDEAHERARLEHQRTVLRLQKDHAASEVTFRSIVTHLEEQLRLARDEVNRVADEARSVTSGLQREIAHDRERHATSLTSAVAKEKLKTEQEAFQLLREIEDQYHKKQEKSEAQLATLADKARRYESSLQGAQSDVESLQSVLQQREDEFNSTKQALDKTQRELHATLRELEKCRAEHTEAAARANLMLQDMQSTSESLHQDAAATIARLQSELDQQATLKDAEIKELKQLVLETRQDAAAKVKASIEEYQTRAHAVSEKVDLMRAQLETAARNDLAALRDDYEARVTGKDEELQELQQQFHEIQRAHAEDKSALVKAHEQELAAMAHAADKKALERQLASDEQHKLEIERLVRGRDQAKRALEDHARGVAAEMATLQDMHQQDIRKQTREYEDMLSTLRAEVVQQACDVERLQHALDSERTAHAHELRDVTAAQRTEREELARRLEQLSEENTSHKQATVSAMQAEHHETLQTQLHALRTTMSRQVEDELAKQQSLLERNLELENELHATNTAHRQAVQDAHNAQREHLRRVEEDHRTRVTALNNDVDVLREAKRAAEDALSRLKTDYEERFHQMQDAYEDKMNGLLPAAMQGQLENTIAALKQQAEALEMKATVLQSHVARSP